ncbi:importin alpha, putative [Trypanosoma cruzi marinkellei]|uniref:Importin subunit alpha n=1 Tax=Trypanosoma cruzi marinkellei TaxID=85056 RepID=K2NF55_TRYCR|nr:importin alpha, putative [Trypanosoma cruzi marinkellei]
MFGGQGEKPKGAKQTPSVKAGAERRQRQMISVRQKAHGELMKYVREDHGEESNEAQLLMNGDAKDVWAYDSHTAPELVPHELLPEFARMVMEGKAESEVFHGTLMIRKMLSVERNPPHDAVVKTGVVPYLSELMDRFENPKLQFEAAWALTNIAAGTTENASALIQHGAIPRFVTLLSSENADCRDQGAWAIGNIAGDGVRCRDLALQYNALPALLQVITTPDQPINALRNATWAISNLTRGKPAPPLDSVSIALPVLSGLLYHSDKEVVTDAAWAISYISDGSWDRVQAVIDAGVVPRMVEFLSSPLMPLQTSAVRTVGNIASGNNEQTQLIINCGFLSVLGGLLTHCKRDIRKEACWTVSNIAAGTLPQIEALITSNVFPLVIKCLEGPDLDVKKEAIWSVANVVLCGIVPHLRYLLECNVIPALCDALSLHETKILTIALEALTGFLQLGDDDVRAGISEENMVAQAMIACGGVNAIERIQTLTDNNLYSMALSILETYFNVEENFPQGGFETSAEFGDGTAKEGTEFDF